MNLLGYCKIKLIYCRLSAEDNDNMRTHALCGSRCRWVGRVVFICINLQLSAAGISLYTYK